MPRSHYGFLREENNEIADSKISVHDQYRFEIKLDIELPALHRSIYRISTYFFVPKALNISPRTYDKHKFHSSSQQYIRFKAPQMSLSSLADPFSPTSPFARVHSAIPKLLAGSKDPALIAATYNDIKLLGAIAKGSIRDVIKQLLGQIEVLHKLSDRPQRFESMIEEILNFLDEIRRFETSTSELRKRMHNPTIPKKIEEAFLFFDEFISLTTEDFLLLLLQSIQKDEKIRHQLLSAEAPLIELIQHQSQHRQNMGYPSVLPHGECNKSALLSVVPYRKGVLKKFISSILFLNLELSDWQGTTQFLFGLAAGIAMLFAVSATLFAQNRFANNSIPFVTIVVISYIFKDRLKDWLKLFLSHRFNHFIWDRKIKIKDPFTDQTIGHVKEAFNFMSYSSVPDEILYRRNMDNITSIDEEGKPERVIKIEKEVVLYPERLLSSRGLLPSITNKRVDNNFSHDTNHFDQRRAISDIMRLNVSDFLMQTDDPHVDFLHLNPHSLHAEPIRCSRTYHVNMVVKYVSSDSSALLTNWVPGLGAKKNKESAKTRYERIRLILNREGILHLEEVLR